MQTLKRGASGTDVELLQRLLCKKSYHVGADGIFGNDTEVAVRKFQKDYGLVSDGIVGQRTWDMLQSDSAAVFGFLASHRIGFQTRSRAAWGGSCGN